MSSRRTRYEVLVATLLNEASLAAFRRGVMPTAVPRRTVYRLRVPADRNLPEVLHRLTDHNVQVLEIRCLPVGRERPTTAPVPSPQGSQPAAPRADADDHPGPRAVVVPFPAGRVPAPSPSATDRTAGRASGPADADSPGAGVADGDRPAARRGHLRAAPR
jgi:hypothetical protein